MWLKFMLSVERAGNVVWISCRRIRVRDELDTVQAIPHDRSFSKPQQSQSSHWHSDITRGFPTRIIALTKQRCPLGGVITTVKSSNYGSYSLPQRRGQLQKTPDESSQIKYGFVLYLTKTGISWDGQTSYPDAQLNTKKKSFGRFWQPRTSRQASIRQ
jgi:hypothetical protein